VGSSSSSDDGGGGGGGVMVINDDNMYMTGGEGCIQSAAASAIGIGSDIGGSIRMPAFFNGVFGHKATAGLYLCMYVCSCLSDSVTAC